MPRRTILYQQWRLGDAVLDESVYPPGLRLDEHSDGVGRLSLVLGGTMTESTPAGRFTPAPLAALIKPGDATHANDFGEAGARIFSVVLLEGAASGRWAHLCTENQEIVRGLLRVRRLALGGSSALQGEIACLVSVADELARPPQSGAQERPRAGQERGDAWGDGWGDAWGEFRQTLSAAALRSEPVERISARLGVHRVHLNRLCRARLGRTTSEYLRWRRAQEAARLLEQTEAPLSEVALMAGFFDQAHLTRTFRAELATTPGEHRRLSRALL